MQNNFSRSNVNESTLSISNPARSSFDLSHRESATLKLGRFTPVSVECIMPGDVFSGSLKPSFTLERANADVPSVGQIRLDTHTFFVSRRRINKKWQNMYQGMSHSRVSSLAATDISMVAETYIRAILLEGHNLQAATKNTLLDLEFADGLDGLIGFVDNMHDGYVSLAAKSGSELAYMGDFFSVEAKRLAQYTEYLSQFESTSDAPSFRDVMAFCIQPLFGEGSVLDFLGYPIIKTSVPSFDKNYASFSTLYRNRPIADVLSYVSYTSRGMQTQFIQFDRTPVVIEPILAVYSAWFDYMRDYHLEPSEGANLLNPDDFDNTNLLPDNLTTLSNTTALPFIRNCAQLLVLKYRYWSRDMLTTVQPDDSYRHVYSPIINDSVGEVSVNPDSEDIVDKAVSILIGDKNIPFLGDSLFHGDPDSSYATFRSDLQTMRRANMLERWLARNFYHPDTYSGQIEARFGIKPLDSVVLSAQYLGGSEQFISGEQLNTSVGTDATPVGTRTFQGGVTTADNFSYSSGGEFGYLISFVSLVPICKYDAINMHLYERTTADLPQPEFAVDTRCTISTGDMVRGLGRQAVLGYVPRYVSWRSRLDGAHGRYLTDYRHYDFLRDFETMKNVDGGTQFVLSPYQLRIHPNMDAFAGLSEWDDVAFGDVECQLHIQRALPAAVEFI